MIEDLIATGVLSPAFSDACWVIRQLGNSAAHADKADIYAYQVEQTIEFVSTIINYLYSMPVRVAEMKKKIRVFAAACFRQGFLSLLYACVDLCAGVSRLVACHKQSSPFSYLSKNVFPAASTRISPFASSR